MAGRKQAQAATRTRAVAAACALLSTPECRELTFESVAKASGVTRVTLYNHFGSRGELLLAVFRELGRRMRAERIRDAMRDGDPVRALERVFVEATRAWQRERRAVARIFALSAFDPEMAREVARSERTRRSSLALLVGRLGEARVLGATVAGEEATATLGALTSFQAFEAFSAAGAAHAAPRLLRLARQSLGVATARPRRKGRQP